MEQYSIQKVVRGTKATSPRVAEGVRNTVAPLAGAWIETSWPTPGPLCGSPGMRRSRA